MAWVPHFDDDNWDSRINPTWDGTEWIVHEHFAFADLSRAGGWWLDYRPTKIRITFRNVGTIDIKIIGDAETHIIAEVAGVTSGREISLSWIWGEDIQVIRFGLRLNEYYITNIEFYEISTICSEALDGMLLQAEALEHYIKTMAPSLYGFNTRNVQQMIDLDAKIPALQDSDLARRNADYFRKLSDQWVHWTKYDIEARKNLI